MKKIDFLMYLDEIEEDFTGWDFSSIHDTGRIQSSLLSWSYGSKVISSMQNATSMLDMGTGGGEFLALLKRFYPKVVYATEGYKLNIPIAISKLEPVGVKVLGVLDDEQLPFENNQFDLIINRHESYSVKEIKRIIKQNGVFITQQVGGCDCKEINEWLGVPINLAYRNWNLQSALQEFLKNEWDILEQKEEYPIQRFYDLGALIYYLKAIPWQIPDFSIEKYKEGLYQIFLKIESEGYVDVTQSRFILKLKLK